MIQLGVPVSSEKLTSGVYHRATSSQAAGRGAGWRPFHAADGFIFVVSADVYVGGFARPPSNREFTTPARRHVGVSGAIAQGKSVFPKVIATGNPESRPPTASGSRISLQVKFPLRPRLFPCNSFLPCIRHATITCRVLGVKTPGPVLNSGDPRNCGLASGTRCPPGHFVPPTTEPYLPS